MDLAAQRVMMRGSSQTASRNVWSGCWLTRRISSRRFSSTPSQRQRDGPAAQSDHNNELFEYTSGRWLYNESLRLRERHLPFNIPELKKAAAKCVDRPVTDIANLTKLAESTTNRVFEISFKDNSSILARMPYHICTPNRYKIASEVATLDFVRKHGIAAPKVLGYEIEENAVGTEYMFMEKMEGKPIGIAWFDLTKKQQGDVLFAFVEMEKKLFGMEIPACGSLYYARDLPSGVRRIEIPNAEGRLCVGPYASYEWWDGERREMDIDRGPFTDALSALQAPALKEISWARPQARPRLPFVRQYREGLKYEKQHPDGYIKALSDYLLLTPHLIPASSTFTTPLLRHPYPHPINILVDENYTVTGYLNWQAAVVLPTFLAAGIPQEFQNHIDGQEHRTFLPAETPDNYADMSAGEKHVIVERNRQREVHERYNMYTVVMNDKHYQALKEKEENQLLVQHLYARALRPWEGIYSLLEYDVLKAVESWGDVATPVQATTTAADDGDEDGDSTVPPCPVTISEEERKRLNALIDDEFREAEKAWEGMERYIAVGEDGWTETEWYDTAVERNQEVKEYMRGVLEKGGEEGEGVEELLGHWWFDDFDEEG
ncbi:hypothetical protein CC80DRAFT_592624 [Byssothecium circinans]|uniref:Uncharacterized protein n=1 Tax=Byssothecium circinans TaxID=147558 RepID=A0A6A5U054_9PLEO|nr:hypothetical protein CC80DRAFT_592624 [Byssothecium circinans]